jgi:hypothetical protein
MNGVMDDSGDMDRSRDGSARALGPGCHAAISGEPEPDFRQVLMAGREAVLRAQRRADEGRGGARNPALLALISLALRLSAIPAGRQCHAARIQPAWPLRWAARICLYGLGFAFIHRWVALNLFCFVICAIAVECGRSLLRFVSGRDRLLCRGGVHDVSACALPLESASGRDPNGAVYGGRGLERTRVRRGLPALPTGGASGRRTGGTRGDSAQDGRA